MRAVLVVGCERSGTTMLGSMLGLASGCLTTPAAPWLFELLALERSRPVSHGDIVRLVASRMPLKRWGSASRAYMAQEQACDGVAEWFDGLIHTYVADHGKPEPATWVSHAPLANRFLVSAAGAFEQTVIIHIVRDGRAVYASLKDLRPLPVSTPREAAVAWRERLCFALAAGHCDSLPAVITVRFEDLVAQPGPTLSRLSAETGLDIPPSAERGGAYILPGSVGHRLVGQAPDPSRIDVWKNRLTSRQVELFEYYSDELLQYFGYEELYGSKARGPSTSEWAAMNMREFARPFFRAGSKRFGFRLRRR